MRKNLIKIISFLILFALFVFPIIISSAVFAQAPAATDDPIGKIAAPSHIDNVGDLESGGVVRLLNSILKTAMVVAGIWVLINLILAGFAYVASGDKPEEITKAGQKIYMSIIGLVIIVGAFTLSAIIGWLVYGDASAILSPKIYGIDPITP